MDCYFEDNRLCFGLKCAPYLYTQITELVVRTMNNREASHILGCLDALIERRNSDKEIKALD